MLMPLQQRLGKFLNRGLMYINGLEALCFSEYVTIIDNFYNIQCQSLRFLFFARNVQEAFPLIGNFRY